MSTPPTLSCGARLTLPLPYIIQGQNLRTDEGIFLRAGCPTRCATKERISLVHDDGVNNRLHTIKEFKMSDCRSFRLASSILIKVLV